MRLTDLQIKKLKPPKKGQKAYFDEGLPGFGVRISQGGTKSFIVMHGARRRLKTIGRYPAMRLAEARQEAKRVQVSVVNEPLSLSTMEPVGFPEASDHFLRECEGRNRARTVSDYRRLLTRHFPFDAAVSEVGRRELMGVISSLARTPAEQQHAYVAVRTMLNWCVRQGLLEISPLPKLTFKAPLRDRVLSESQ